jgi:type VI protein secretion system component VasK
MADSTHSPLQRTRAVARGAFSGFSALLLALVVALGIPLVWIWIASQLAGTKRDLTPSLALVITTGILVSYWVALVVGSRLRARWVSADEHQATVRRMSWNRSFRDEPLHAGDEQSDPVERLFVIVAVIGVIAFEVWFFFFAGSPLPNQPAF